MNPRTALPARAFGDDPVLVWMDPSAVQEPAIRLLPDGGPPLWSMWRDAGPGR
ncbi:hypothetical protein ACH4U5_10485 [Streptomyces sp. NPDC020858]|uniref:hypothetical protein n=1 Tax=Streptomyces sp. NPDC020858 TaxID=3365097 RepID=UPI00378D2078